MVLCVTRFFHSRFFSLRKFNFNVNFVTLPSSHLEKTLGFFHLISFLKKTFYFPLWRSLGSFTLLKLNFKADPLLLSTLVKSRFFFVVKAKIYRQLCFFSLRLGFFSLSKLRFTANCIFFHFGSFTLLKPNFKADPISKVTFHFGFFTLLNPNFKADPISKVFSCC
ncbi:unnamed protein product [Rhizophagus irregularis]|nr:unnamed protein product [Rhizophagus irregularis]